MRASRLSRYSWTMFDFANQPFYTLIMTFVFSVYFTDVLERNVEHILLASENTRLDFQIIVPIILENISKFIDFFIRLNDEFILSIKPQQ